MWIGRESSPVGKPPFSPFHIYSDHAFTELNYSPTKSWIYLSAKTANSQALNHFKLALMYNLPEMTDREASNAFNLLNANGSYFTSELSRSWPPL
jgi:hypothetical protein